MKILLNAASTQMGGGVTYLRGLLPWLLRVDGSNVVKLIAPGSTTAHFTEDATGRLDLVEYPFASSAGPRRVFFDQVWIPREIRAWGAEVLLSTTGFATLRSPIPQIVLIPNALYFAEGRRHYLNPGHMSRTLLSHLSIRAADHVIFPSAALLDQAVKAAPEVVGKGEVLHHGFDEAEFLHHEEGLSGARSLEGWKSEGWSVLVTVSSYARHKNLETLIEALGLLARQGRRIKFVTTLSRGETGEKRAFDKLLHQIDQCSLNDRVHHLGSVPRSQLPPLYRMADLFVFPSLIESFGFPLVEAMALGVPIVAADIPTSREICEDAAVYFDPRDPKECAERIELVLDDSSLRESLRERARRRVRVFSWEAYAKRITRIIHGLTAAPSPRL